MHNTTLTLVLLAASAVAHAGTGVGDAPAAGPTVAGRVESVVLYRDSARVTRVVDVPAGARGADGAIELVVDDLPTRIVPESLRVEATGDVVASSVAHRVEVPGGESVKAQPTWSRRIEDRREAIGIELEMLARQSEILDALAGFAGRALPADLDRGLLQAGETTQLALFAFEHRERLALRVEALSRESRRLGEEQVRLEAARADALARAPRNVAVVRLEARGEAPSAVRLEYAVAGVGWEPGYRVSGVSGSGDVEVRYLARVRQGSGEDWRDAALVLAPHAAPRRSHAPRLERLPLSVTRSSAPGGVLAAALDLRQLEELATALEPARAGEAVAGAVRESLRRFAVGRVTLASRAEPSILPLADYTLAGELYRVAVPVAGPLVYREASMVNDTGDALPAGPVLAYYDGEFVGEGRLAGVAPGERFAVGLGADPLLRATRHLVEREESLEGSAQRVAARYRLVVENRGEAPAALRLLERIPVARGESGVRVSLQPTEVALHDAGAADGLLRWDVDVPVGDGSPWSLDYRLVVRYDRGFHLALDAPGRRGDR